MLHLDIYNVGSGGDRKWGLKFYIGIHRTTECTLCHIDMQASTFSVDVGFTRSRQVGTARRLNSI